MKFYSYSNENRNYVKAFSLEGIRSIELVEGSGKSQVRFSVRINYFNSDPEHLSYLFCAESKKVYTEILNLLNKSIDKQPKA